MKLIVLQNYDTASQFIGDTNQNEAWPYNDEFPSQTQTNQSSLAMTTTSLPTQHQSRDEIESSIKEFSRLWPSQTQTVHPHTSIGFSDSRNCTVATSDIKNDSSGNYLKRNGVLGVPLSPLCLETEPNAWDLATGTVECPNGKWKFRIFKYGPRWKVPVYLKVNDRLIA